MSLQSETATWFLRYAVLWATVPLFGLQTVLHAAPEEGNALNWALHFSRLSDSVNIDGTTKIEEDMTIEAIVAFDRTGTRDNLFIEDWVEQGQIGQKNFGVSPSSLHGYAFPRDFEADFFRVKVDLALRRWHHVAFVVDGQRIQGVDDKGSPVTYTKQRMYLNGRLVAERETSTDQISETVTSCLLGFGWTGYISSFRISGVARYEGDSYEPSYTKLPTDEDTLLLYNFSKDPGNGLIEDESGNERTGRLGIEGPRTPNPTSPAYVLFGPDLSVDTDKDGVTDYRESSDGTDLEDRKSFEPLSKSLVAHYLLNRSFNDSTGFARDASISTGEGKVVFVEGVDEEAITVDANASISAPASFTNMRRATLAFWIRRSQDPFIYIEVNDGAQRGLAFGWGWRDGRDEPGFYVRRRGANRPWTGPYFAEALDVPRNMWTHVAIAIDTGGRLVTYVNGKATGTFRIRGSIPWAANPRKASIVFLSNDPSRSIGRFDDIRLYQRLLSAREVARLHAEINPDADGDGLLDRHETNTGTYVSLTDTGTDPRRADTNDDGIPDGHAVRAQLDPLADFSGIVEFIKTNPQKYNLWSETDYQNSRSLGQEEGRMSVINFPARNGMLRLADLPKLAPLEIEMPVGTPFRLMLVGDNWTRHGVSIDPLLSEGPAGVVYGSIFESTAATARLVAYNGSLSTRTHFVTLGAPGQITAAPEGRSRLERSSKHVAPPPQSSQTATTVPAKDSNSDGVPDALASALGFGPATKLSGIVSYVKTNPRQFVLRNNEEYRESLLAGREQGKAEVLASPRDFGLVRVGETPLAAELRLEIPPRTWVLLRSRGWNSPTVNANAKVWSVANLLNTVEVLGASEGAAPRTVKITGKDETGKTRSPIIVTVVPASL